MADQCAFDFSSSNAMASDVEHIVNAADDPEIAVLVLPATVAGEVTALDLAPINFLVTFWVAPEAAEHGRPRFAQYEFAAAISRHRLAQIINHFGQNAEEREGTGTGFGWDRARQWRDQD